MLRITFTSKNKTKHTCTLSSQGTHCIWDKHLITDWDSVVHCPIRYNPTEVTKDSSIFVIKDRVTTPKTKKHMFVHKQANYECEGVVRHTSKIKK